VRTIVSDTGPLLHLIEVGELTVLQEAGEVSVPRSVEAELSCLHVSWDTNRPAWVATVELRPPFASEAIAWQQAGLLHAGEAEALALARQLGADWLLTDDAAARLVGQAHGLEVHGSLGIILWAAAAGYREHHPSEAALDRLARSSLWLSSRVLEEAREALRQLFS
jgi:predicted nucleic acid-binding protein